MPTPGRTIADASPAYARIAAIVNGVLCLIGILVAAYVYREFPHPNIVEYSGKLSISTESVESYIFTYPVMQAVIFVIPAIQSLRWNTALRRSLERELVQRAKNPRLQRLDSVLVYYASCALIVMTEISLLGLTINRAFVLTAKGL